MQLLLTITRAPEVVVVDDGTATMEFAGQLARGERLVRWHRKGGRPGPRDLALAPVSAAARRRLTPGEGRTVEVFTSMPMADVPPGVTVRAHTFAWTRDRFGPPRVTRGADLVGTSLVETGVVDADAYVRAVGALAATHGARRYFAHRRETTEKLHRLAVETGLEIVRPELPWNSSPAAAPWAVPSSASRPPSSTRCRSRSPELMCGSRCATSTRRGSPPTPPRAPVASSPTSSAPRAAPTT